MKLPLAVATLCFTVSLQAQTIPILVGGWRFDDNRHLKFDPDKTAFIWTWGQQPMKGKWEEDPFTDQIKRFSVTWSNGQAYDIEISPDGSTMRGKRKTGEDPITAKRVEELKVFLWANDLASVSVNGTQIMSAGIKKVEEGYLWIRSGDVITVNLANKGGVMELGFEAFKGTKKFLTAGELYYTEAPEIDWQKTPKLAMGYRRPLAPAKRGFVIGPVKDAAVAIPQKQDENYRKLHFKYVVK